MFDRFTERARKVMGFARREAQRFHHEYIGTEHILLGLIQEGQGVAANVLKSNGLRIKVAGNSFMTSTNTIISAVCVELFLSGM